MKALTELERQDLIRRKIKETSETLLRLSQLIGEFTELGVDAAFEYEPTPDGYGGNLSFRHSVQDKTVYVNDNEDLSVAYDLIVEATGETKH